MRQAVVATLLCLVGASLCQSPWQEPCSHSANSRCFDATCAQPVFNRFAGRPCQCVDDDIGSKFSECDTRTNTRQLIYFWKPPATCLNGTLPPPVSNVPCTLTCGEGTFLNVSTVACESCPKGYYSSGGGQKWNDWHYMPAQFSTHCAIGGGKNCSSWRLIGETIDSGDNYNLHYLQSVLELRVHLVRPGDVSFEYRVSAEANFDGLWFIVDDLGLEFVSNAGWNVMNKSLSAGYHTLQWQYYKDRTLSAGEDKAEIRWIKVRGTTYAPNECQECPLGHYGNRTSAGECVPCPAGTYNPDTIAATECKPCPPGTYSFPGAISCIPSRACNTTAAGEGIDYTAYYTPCVNGFRNKMYSWFSPTGCDTTNKTLPLSKLERCTVSSCLPGQRLDENRACVYCPDGTASSPANASRCDVCKKGTAATDRIRYFDSWNLTTVEWPSDTGSWETGCEGEACFTLGWRRGGNFIDSGVGHGRGAGSWVQYQVDVFDGAEFSFYYSLQCIGDNELVFSIDDIVLLDVSCGGCTGVTQQFNYTFQVESALHKKATLRWLYTKRANLNNQCDRAIVYNLTVVGVRTGNGGAASCSSCRPGTFAPNDQMTSCDLCPPGSTSYDEATSCVPCTNGTFADKFGTPTCLECGVGTESTPDFTHCTFNCSSVQFNVTGNNNNSNNTSNSTDVIPSDIKRIYNVEALGEWNISFVEMINGTAQTYTFMGGVCEWSTACTSRSYPINGYICIDYAMFDPDGGDDDVAVFPLSLGRTVDISELSPVGTGVRFLYKAGSYLSSESECSATLDVMCVPGQTPDSTQGPMLQEPFSRTSFENDCHLSLIWKTSAGCRLCTANDYRSFESECKDGKATKSYYLTNSYCAGGEPMPASETVDCETHVKVSKSTVGVLVAVIVLVVVGAIGGIVFLYMRNRKLYADYAKLVQRDVPLESEDNFRIGEEE